MSDNCDWLGTLAQSRQSCVSTCRQHIGVNQQNLNNIMTTSTNCHLLGSALFHPYEPVPRTELFKNSHILDNASRVGPTYRP